MNVFCVFSGAYSDRGMIGVFSTRELAQEYIDREKMCGRYEIDDEPIEEELDKIKPRNTVTIRIENGEARIYYAWLPPTEGDGWVSNTGYDGRDDYIVTVNFNPDTEVMIKAARDRLASWKALKEGI